MSEWTEWNGGEMPVKRNSLVDVKHRDGDVYTRVRAGKIGGRAEFWGHINHNFAGDIVAYRPSAPKSRRRIEEL